MAWKLAYITAVLPLALGWQLPILHCLCILLCTAAALWLWPAWPGRVSLPVMLAVAAGLLHSQYVLHAAIASRMPASYDGSEIVVEGRIVGPVSRQMLAGGRPWQRFDFQLTTQPVPGHGQAMPAGLQRLRLSAYTPERFHSGEYRRLQLRLRAARNYANPGSFDYQRYLLARRIDALGTVLQVHPAVGEYGTHALERSRSVQRDTIVRALDGLPAQPLLQALLLGERSGLGSKQRDLLVKTGTVHLFAIATRLSRSYKEEWAVVSSLGMSEFKNHAPAYAGFEIEGRNTFTAKRPSRSKQGMGVVDYKCELFNQDNDLLFEFSGAALYRLRQDG